MGITEETIKQTKFYQDEVEQHYLVTDVRSVKLVTLISCGDGAESKLLLGDDVCSQFFPVDATFKPFIQNQVVVQSPESPEPKQATIKSRKTPSGKRSKCPSSQFKGVKKSKKPYKDGRDRFEVNFYDRHTQKVKYLGSFDNEYLAAAKYQEHAGNEAEAQRLRKLAGQDQDNQARPGDMAKQQRADMAEQKENNPNRSTAKKKKTVTIYVCKKCGLEWKSKPTLGCPASGCDGDDFRETTE